MEQDFNASMDLIEETEKFCGNIDKIRIVYDVFLDKYPLCYCYWKRYADHEVLLGNIGKAREVYDRAANAASYSVDMWCDYCMFVVSTYGDNAPDVRRQFDIALSYVGTNYRSNTLWDEYIKFEESLQSWKNVATIYTKILEHPIQHLDRYFNCLKKLVSTQSLSEILTFEKSGMYGPSLTEADSQAKYLSVREEMYKKAKEYDSKVIGFELAIRRPYFHIQALDKHELVNWHSYLDFIEREDDIFKVIHLYERCVIACANYSEFWIRYVQCMYDRKCLKLAEDALTRATHVFVKKQAEIHLFSARFKELNGDAAGARSVYKHLYSELYPGLLEAIVKHANMEQRLGDKKAACLVYEKAIVSEREKERSHLLHVLLVQYSRFLYMVCDFEKAREILSELHGIVNPTKETLEAAIFLESIFPFEKRLTLLDSLVEKFLATESTDVEVASGNDKEQISSIFLEVLDIFGNAQLIMKAATRHTILFSCKRSILQSKTQREDGAIMSDRDKVAKTGDATQSVMGTDPNAPNPSVWPATYGASQDEISQFRQRVLYLEHELSSSRKETKAISEHRDMILKDMELFGCVEVDFFMDFIAVVENALVERYTFEAATLMGSVPNGTSMYPCTPTGLMAANGYFGQAEAYYLRGLCWAGNFSMSDMIVIDGVYFKIRKTPTARLTLGNIKLDIKKWKSNLLKKFKTTVIQDGRQVDIYPPYFDDLFEILNNPPSDFDTNETGKDSYLKSLFTNAAFATASARMMSLVNFAQLHKTLEESEMKALEENHISEALQEGWREVFHSDILLDLIYQNDKPIKHVSGSRVEVHDETASNHAIVLRHTFIHLPEKTLDRNRQRLKSHRETDLLIAYYHKDFVAKFLRTCQYNVRRHPLLLALWEFYMEGRRSFQPRLRNSRVPQYRWNSS